MPRTIKIPARPIGAFPNGCAYVYVRATDGMEIGAPPEPGAINGIRCDVAIPFALNNGEKITMEYRDGRLWLELSEG